MQILRRSLLLSSKIDGSLFRPQMSRSVHAWIHDGSRPLAADICHMFRLCVLGDSCADCPEASRCSAGSRATTESSSSSNSGCSFGIGSCQAAPWMVVNGVSAGAVSTSSSSGTRRAASQLGILQQRCAALRHYLAVCALQRQQMYAELAMTEALHAAALDLRQDLTAEIVLLRAQLSALPGPAPVRLVPGSGGAGTGLSVASSVAPWPIPGPSNPAAEMSLASATTTSNAGSTIDQTEYSASSP